MAEIVLEHITKRFPAVVANNYFVTRLKQIQANTDSLSRILLAYLKHDEAGVPAKKKA